MLKNKIHGETVLENPSKLVVTSLKRSLRQVQKELKRIEDELLILVKEVHQKVLTNLKSIPGIGPKTSLMLVVLTDGFERFKSGRELCSYAGLTPIIRNSEIYYLCAVLMPVNIIKLTRQFMIAL